MTVQTTTFRVGAITAPGETTLADVDLPAPDHGEVVVRIEASAICTWEQRTYSGQQEGRFPFIGGHEVAGEIIEFGPGYRGDLAVGDRVALGGAACGSCHWCWTGQDRMCPDHYGSVVDYPAGWGPGGFAEFKMHRADAVFPLGDVSPTVGCLAEPLSCALHAARALSPTVAGDAVVIGAGVMGLMNVTALKTYGARVIVSEVDAGRLDRAKAMGADELIDASSSDPVEAVRELTSGRGADVVVVAFGSGPANEQGMAMLAERGSLALFASAHPEAPLELSPNQVHKREHRVIGTFSSEKPDFYAATRLIRHGLVDLTPLIQAEYPLAQFDHAMRTAAEPGTYRIVITP